MTGGSISGSIGNNTNAGTFAGGIAGYRGEGGMNNSANASTSISMLIGNEVTGGNKEALPLLDGTRWDCEPAYVAIVGGKDGICTCWYTANPSKDEYTIYSVQQLRGLAELDNNKRPFHTTVGEVNYSNKTIKLAKSAISPLL